MLNIEVFQAPVSFKMKIDNNGNYFTVRHLEFTVSAFFSRILCKDVSLLDFVKFFAKLIDKIENFSNFMVHIKQGFVVVII